MRSYAGLFIAIAIYMAITINKLAGSYMYMARLYAQAVNITICMEIQLSLKIMINNSNLLFQASTLGLRQLCRHNFEHNRYLKASSIMPA